jgi:thioredoxin 1
MRIAGIKFIKIDVDENEAAAGAAGITAVPTFCVYQGGKVVRTFSGADTASLTAACEELSK